MNSSPSGEANGAKRTSWVLDASALLAVALDEPGGGEVHRAISQGASISSVNLSETITRLMEDGTSSGSVLERLSLYDLQVVDFSVDDAAQTASLRAPTRSRGLSLGDRACLALAQRLGLPALTADRHWGGLDVGVDIVLCR